MEQREIKFRKWHRDLKDIVYSELHISDFFQVVQSYPEMYILMQYIGIKDKNEKEVYDGDIVKLEWQTANFGKYFQSDDMWIDHSKIVVIKWVGLGFAFMDGDKQFGKRKNATIEVIGNIYEHPHLLTPPSTTN